MLFPLALVPLLLLLSPTALAAPARKCAKIEKRREWRTLSDEEKAAYISAVKCMATKPSSIASEPVRNGTLYDDFAWTHYSVTYTQHWVSTFLAWHRGFVQKYHDALKTRCGYKGAMVWWDWEQDWRDLPKSPVFNSDPKIGFGTTGHGVLDAELGGYALTDGAFANWTSPVADVHLLSRNFTTPSPYGGPDMGIYGHKWVAPAYMSTVHEAKTFAEFWHALEGTNFYVYRNTPAMRNGPHSDVHQFMGGDMGAIQFSGSDPLFFLHHAKVDQLWAKWQARDPSVRRDVSNRLAYSGNRIQNSTVEDAKPTDVLRYNGLGEDPTVASVYDTTAFPLCYEY